MELELVLLVRRRRRLRLLLLFFLRLLRLPETEREGLFAACTGARGGASNAGPLTGRGAGGATPDAAPVAGMFTTIPFRTPGCTLTPARTSIMRPPSSQGFGAQHLMHISF